MALETPKTKSEIKGNITSLKTRIENQEKLIKSYETIVNNLNSKITAFQRYVNIEKILKVEADRNKITKLNIEKTALEDKYPVLSGKNQAAVEAEIVSLENEKKDRQNDLDKEIAVLDEDKLNLRDHKAIDSKRPFAWMSKRGLATAGIAAGAVFGTWLVHDVFQGKNDKDSKDDKNKTEQTTPKADTTIKKGTKDTVYVMPAPAPSKKDTVYIPSPSKKDPVYVKAPSKNKDVVNRMKDTTKKGPEAKTGNFVNIDGVKYEKMTQAPDPSLIIPNGDYRKVGGDWYQKFSGKKDVATGNFVNIDGVKYEKMTQAPNPSDVKAFGDYRKVGGDWYKKSL